MSSNRGVKAPRDRKYYDHTTNNEVNFLRLLARKGNDRALRGYLEAITLRGDWGQIDRAMVERTCKELLVDITKHQIELPFINIKPIHQKPNPLLDTDHKRVNCDYYEGCLETAVGEGWEDFSCDDCGAFKVLEPRDPVMTTDHGDEDHCVLTTERGMGHAE